MMTVTIDLRPLSVQSSRLLLHCVQLIECNRPTCDSQAEFNLVETTVPNAILPTVIDRMHTEEEECQRNTKRSTELIVASRSIG